MKTKHQKNCLKLAVVCWLVVSMALLAGCFANWSKKDRALFWGFAGLNAVDTWQTFDAFDDPDKRELNPIMQSKGSVVVVKLIGMGVIYWIADANPKHRTAILGACDGVMSGVVLWNSQVD